MTKHQLITAFNKIASKLKTIQQTQGVAIYHEVKELEEYIQKLKQRIEEEK